MRTKAEIADAFAERDRLGEHQAFFLVGIGGAGMSGIAKMLLNRGYAVRGSDSTPSPVTEELQALGIDVRIGHSGAGIEAGDALVLTDAIELAISPEVRRAQELEVPLFRRSQVLGWLLEGRKTIAVTGTHGKTTTTAMIGAALRASGLDPSIVVGAGVPEFGGQIVEGSGEWAVVEACEAYDSFHDLDPHLVVLTNLELDHVDFHGSYENLRDSVLRFVQRVPSSGGLIYCEQDPGADEIATLAGVPIEPYRADTFAERLKDEGIPAPELALPGQHNRLNAGAAMAAAERAGADLGRAGEAIARFVGAERRLQVLWKGPITVVDDYAHHPTEIQASLSALRERLHAGQRLVVVYQPHLYSRTAPLITEFAEALSLADHVVLTDIYPAREAPVPGVSSARIAELTTVPTDYVPSRHLLPRFVAERVRDGDVVVGMGAGNIGEFAPALVEELKRPKGPSLRIAVVHGGDSAEREVSFHSGLAIEKALGSLGHEPFRIDVTETLLSGADLRLFVGPCRPDVAFLAVHGTHAEDGAIQGFFELLHIPYTGSGVQASAMAMDKQLTKDILRLRGLPVPRGVLIRDAREPLPEGMRAPLVVKPNAQGSTVGLSFVESDEQLLPAIEKAFHYDSAVLVEEWIRGMEISVPVLGTRALPAVEIVPNTSVYDFASKYTPGATDEICPARLPDDLAQKAQTFALAAHQALGCEGATRTDMMVRGDEIFVLEVNTLPGMTGTSLLPKSAQTAGMDFQELVRWILEDALRRSGSKA